MNWKLYKKDDHNTWPEIDCPILVYDDDMCEFYICKWNHSLDKFVEPQKQILHHWKECYYQYIEYVPNGYTEFKALKCGASLNAVCQYEDDGYCFDCPSEIQCKYMYEEPLYILNDNKRIWKEFE